MSNTILLATADTSRIEAPITIKGFLMVAFAAMGGLFFGYDSGYLNGIMGMPYFIQLYTGLDPKTTPPEHFLLPTWEKSLMTSILYAGTFFGSLLSGDLADFIGRRNSIILGCAILDLGALLQTVSKSLALFVTGRIIAGFAIGIVTAVIILYISETSPRKIRGATIAVYGLFISAGLLVASAIDYSTQIDMTARSYRLPCGLMMIWATILGMGLLFLPESPRYYVRKGKLDKAAMSLSKVRGQPIDSPYVQNELSEIIANYEYELQVVPQDGYVASWLNCFKGSLSNPSSNIRRTLLTTTLFAMVQWSGANFIFFFGTTFFQQIGTINNPFLISIITTLVDVLSSPVALYTVDRFGRRIVLIVGMIGMTTCQFLVAIIGIAGGTSQSAMKAEIAFICIYIFFFAPSWGPVPWTLAGELFPLPIRSRGVALCGASNFFWACVS